MFSKGKVPAETLQHQHGGGDEGEDKDRPRVSYWQRLLHADQVKISVMRLSCSYRTNLKVYRRKRQISVQSCQKRREETDTVGGRNSALCDDPRDLHQFCQGQTSGYFAYHSGFLLSKLRWMMSASTKTRGRWILGKSLRICIRRIRARRRQDLKVC